MLRRLCVAALAAVMLAACSDGNAAPSPESVPAGKCAPSADNPTLGMAAINSDYRVVVWNQPGSTAPRELEQLGDDPFAESYGGDYTVVESVAVSTSTCDVFVGACCEPVSGITYHDKQGDGEWEMLTGHLPAISPDGELLSLVTNEQLVVSSVADPETAIATFDLPNADIATMYRSRWINGDEVAVSGFTKDGSFVWVARVSEGTLREAFRITPDITSGSDHLWRVGLIGVDESGNIVTGSVSSSNALVVEHRYPDSFEVHRSDNAPEGMSTYVISGARSAMTDKNGVLTVWFGNGDPVAVDGSFVWAG